MTPYQKAGFNELSLFRSCLDYSEYGSEAGSVLWLKRDDGTDCVGFGSRHTTVALYHSLALISELPKDADGFYPWDGGECPVPGDWVVQVKTRQEPCYARKPRIASEWSWRIIGGGGDITAFKPVSRPDMPSVAECATEETASALDVQEGGDHYKKLKIQPMEYSMANGLDACQHTIIKYVTRFRDKGGIEDLRKAKHCIDMLIEFEAEALEGGE